MQNRQRSAVSADSLIFQRFLPALTTLAHYTRAREALTGLGTLSAFSALTQRRC